MKAYTDIEQSKKLAEILPLESADMFYRDNGIDVKLMWEHIAQKVTTPCWSLAALLSVLPDEITHGGSVYRNMFFHLKGEYIIQYPRLTTLWPSLLSVEADNPVDACYEMILKLKEKNLL